MALVGDDLKTALKDAIITEFTIAPENQTDLIRWADAVGNAIVDYFKANAELDGAVLDDDGITGTVTGGSDVDGTVDDVTVSGGIK